MNDEHVLWVGFPFFQPCVILSLIYPVFHTVINPTPPRCIQHRSALPPTSTKKRKLFHLLNPFIHGLQVISPYSRHNPGPSGREREREWERREKDHIETETGRDAEGETERVRQKEREREVAKGGNAQRGKDIARNKKYGDKQQCC